MALATLRRKFKALRPMLTERSRRVWAASEALALGHGGIGLVERATGISRSTISRGIHELDAGEVLSGDRTRRPGGGRKRTVDTDPRLVADLDALVEPTASGDPDSPLRWTSKSVRHLATELQAMGHEVSYRLVMELLHAADYSLQANRKTRECVFRSSRSRVSREAGQPFRFKAFTGFGPWRSATSGWGTGSVDSQLLGCCR